MSNNRGGQGGQVTHTTFDFLSLLNKYIPGLVLQQLISRQNKGQGVTAQLPELQQMETVCMFADISGFTKVGEACAAKGVRGNEELAFCINRYMEGMCRNLGKYGGDIIKFVGDAMIIMWPQPENVPEADRRENAQLTCRKAIQCAIDIQKEMNNFQVIQGVASLSVKIGIGFGKCALLYVGGVFGRAEYFTVGQSLTNALKSEEQATEGGQIIVNSSAYQYVKDFYQSEEIEEHGDKFYRIIKLVGQGLRTTADAVLLRSNLSSEMFNRIAPQLKGCVPNAIVPFLQIGTEEYGSETRSLTVMFASLGVELSSAETVEGMNKIQRIVTTVQEQVYRMRGSVNKLVMDDKGSTLICLWGLSPMASEDDAARAILAAFNIRRALYEIDHTWCNVGISSGELFSGVVGTSGGRKEFSVLGDVANLAARVMYWPKKNKVKELTKNQIHCDLNTRQLASNFFTFKYAGHQEFKGKSISIPIFVPTDPAEETAEVTKKVLKPEFFIKPHMNPMELESSKEKAASKSKMDVVGSAKDLMPKLTEDIVDFFSQPEAKSPFLIALKGEIGSGKSLFARRLIEELCSHTSFQMLFDEKFENKLPIFCSSVNSESQFNFLNNWRPILQQMLTFFAKNSNMTRQQVLKLLMEKANDGLKSNEDKVDVLCDIFAVSKDAMYKTGGLNPNAVQIKPKFQIAQFVKRICYEDNDVSSVIALITFFVKWVVGEEDSGLEEVSGSHKAKEKQKTDGMPPDHPPILVFIDTAHMMDEPSYKFLQSIVSNVRRIGLILILQTDTMDVLKIPPESRQEFDRVWLNMENLRVIDLPSLDHKGLTQLIKLNAGKYQMAYIEEITNMTSIVDKNDTIKTEEQGKEWVRVLSKKWQTVTKIQEINPKIIEIVVQKCAGNPLLCLQYFVNLLQNDFIVIDDNGKVGMEPKFVTCMQLNDYSSVPVPRFAIKINTSSVDRYLQATLSKTRLRPGEVDTVVKSIVMMKAATVLGDEFELKALIAIQPLRTKETLASMAAYVKQLEASDFLEVLDGGDRENLSVRFSKVFLRETIYQLVLYNNQKKGLHGAAAQYFLETPTSVSGGEKLADPVIQLKILKEHLLKSQDFVDESNLSLTSRTELQVRHIQNVLKKSTREFVIKQVIIKQGKGANKKASNRLCTIDSNDFRWYHDEEELQSGVYLGSIPVQFVYQTVASKLVRGENAAFSLSTSSWFDKQGEEKGSRDFYFACREEHDRDKWVITIEFLRTKAVYDAYAQKNIAVQFPLSLGPRKREANPDQRDLQSLLWDFGSQLKNVSAGSGKSSANLEKNKLSNYNSNQNQVDLSHEELVARLKACYNIGICSFSTHIINTSAKMTVKQQSAQIGQNPTKESTLHQHAVALLGVKPTQMLKYLPNKWQLDNSENTIQREQRLSSISENTKSTLEQLLQSSKHEQIREETEDQSSEDQRKNKSTILNEIQRLEVVETQRDALIIMQKGSEESKSSPLTIVLSASPPEESRNNVQQNRQTFSQTAASDNFFIQSTDNTPAIGVAQKMQEPTVAANFSDTSYQNFLQQMIEKQIAEKIKVLVKQNEQNLLSQKQELGKIISQQQELLNRSMQTQMLVQSNSEGYLTPQRVLRNSNSLLLSSTLEDFNNRLNTLKNVTGGITSTSKNRKIIEVPDSKGITSISEESDHPADPDLNSSDIEIEIKPQVKLAKLLQRDFTHQDYQLKNENPQTKFAKEFTYQDNNYHQRHASSDSHATQKRNNHAVVSKPASQLIHFQDERLYFPPPERWVDNDYALYEEPLNGKVYRVPEKPREEVLGVCTKDSSCQLNGRKFQILQGQQVAIVDSNPQLKLFKIAHKGRTGLFLMQDFTLLKRTQSQHYSQFLQSDSHIAQMSPIHPAESQNFFKEVPDKELTVRMGKMSAADLALRSQRLLDEDKANLKKQNMKIIDRQRKRIRKQQLS